MRFVCLVRKQPFRMCRAAARTEHVEFCACGEEKIKSRYRSEILEVEFGI
jgi:hypothetical protein